MNHPAHCRRALDALNPRTLETSLPKSASRADIATEITELIGGRRSFRP
jgi:hypothetical protein